MLLMLIEWPIDGSSHVGKIRNLTGLLLGSSQEIVCKFSSTSPRFKKASLSSAKGISSDMESSAVHPVLGRQTHLTSKAPWVDLSKYVSSTGSPSS